MRTSEPDLLIDGPRRAPTTIVPAHGAGAGMDTEFMNAFAGGLARHGLRVVRFEFPYMAARRETGKSRPPDREPVLRDTWLRVIEAVRAKTLFIGGKSMGGRNASLVADESQVTGLVCLWRHSWAAEDFSAARLRNSDRTRFIGSAGSAPGVSVDFRHAWGINHRSATSVIEPPNFS